MPDCLRVHLESGDFVDMPPDCQCTESSSGSLLFQLSDGRPWRWYRAGLVAWVERVPYSTEPTIVPSWVAPWPDAL
jgi:hypothetical protein